MYSAHVIAPKNPRNISMCVQGEVMLVKKETVRELYYACYSISRMLSNITQQTVGFRLFNADGYVSQIIFVHPRKVSHYTLPDI